MEATVLPQRNESLGEAAEPRPFRFRKANGDRVFGATILISGLVVLVIMGGVGVFLTWESLTALRIAGFDFFTTSTWEVAKGEFGIAALIPFTIYIALIAVLVSTPISIGLALFITEIAPPRIKGLLIGLVDLMAALPSVVFGLWGLYALQSHVVPLARWIDTWLGWIPLFAVSGTDPNDPLMTNASYSASTFLAALVVALMVMPIQCAVMREVFSQVPIGEREGAYALGSTRWGMITVVSLPFGRAGIIGGTMLGLGRALGETIAVALLISPRFDFTAHMLEKGSNSVSAHIATQYVEASDIGLSALFAAGLALFSMTLAVNLVASWFVARSRSGASSEA